MSKKVKSTSAFTKPMRKTHTILAPMMLPIHFSFLNDIFHSSGYKMELLTSTDPAIVETGLKYVHNDTCYPALLVIGQLIHALESGRYDPDTTALMLTQTGGGCRASNYIHLLRKALKKAGFEHVPVISLNFAGTESSPGFSMTLPMIRKVIAGMAYGDCLMLLKNQVSPYELTKGDTAALVDRWVKKLCEDFRRGKGFRSREMAGNFENISDDFAKIPVCRTPKIKVGIVGEIYVKYAALGNNNLELLLTEKEGCEVRVPGLMGFLLYCLQNNIEDAALYGTKRGTAMICRLARKYFYKVESAMISAVRRHPEFDPPAPFRDTMKGVEGIIGLGCKMGEGWLLTAEMVELIEAGIPNIVCTQPFGCLPNHISGKGMIRKLRQLDDDVNIVPIDYDPSATAVNQENRIKLMLAMAREKLAAQTAENR